MHAIQFTRQPRRDNPDGPTLRQTLHTINFKVVSRRVLALAKRKTQFCKPIVGDLPKKLQGDMQVFRADEAAVRQGVFLSQSRRK